MSIEPLRTGTLRIFSRSQSQNLFHMMASVHPVKLSPLIRCEWAEDRMVEHTGSRTVKGFASGNELTHLVDSGNDFSHHFFGGHSLRDGAFGCFSTLGKISQPYDQSDLHSLLPGDRTCQRLARPQT